MAQTISALQKYAVKHYLIAVHKIVALYLLLSTQDPSFFAAYCFLMLVAGYYLPFDDTENTHYLREQNQKKWALIPLILDCFATPIILCIIWLQFDLIVQNSFTNGIVLLIGLGSLIAPSMDASHELIHRQETYCTIIGLLNLYCFDFTVYPIEHLYLHHKKVGTTQDPITSPKNQNLYRFYVKAIVSAYKFNYKYSKKIFWGCVFATLSHITLIMILSLKQGRVDKIIFFVGLSYLCLFLLESVQYIEHYGLIYRISDKSKPVTEICSWNTEKNWLVNSLFFKFERHSDHHMNAYKLYNTLEITDKMPQYPFDFSSANFLSMIPPVWYWIANPLVDEVIQGKKTDKIHIKNVKAITHIFRVIIIVNFAVQLFGFA